MNKKKSYLIPKNAVSLFLGIIAIITISCDHDPSSLGSNFLPDGTIYRYDTSFTFTGNVYEEDDFFTSNQSYYSIGMMEDAQFGQIKSEYLGQFIYSGDSTIVDQHNQIDSAFLLIAIDSIYGPALTEIEFSAYELTKEIDDEGEYYSTTDISTFFAPENIISTEGQFRGDSIYAIRLSSGFYRRLTSSGYSIYRSGADFISEFNGIAIIPNMINQPGGMLYANISSAETKVVLHYSDSLTYNYYLSSGHRFAKYTNDYSGSEALNYLQNPDNENDSLLYLQGIKGLTSKITFTNLDEWFDTDSTYSVINAELFMPVYKDADFDLFGPPEKLYFKFEYWDGTDDSDTSLFLVEDYYDVVYSKGIFDGSYNAEEGHYRFFIPKHLMSLLNRDIENQSLHLSIYSKTQPQRVILKSDENIKLKVTYTKH